MKYVLFILISSVSYSANAAKCHVVDKQFPLSVVFQYEGPCDQSRFTGKIGDATKTEHLSDAQIQAQMDARLEDSRQRTTKRTARRAALKLCAQATDLTAAQVKTCLQSLVKEVAESEFTAGEL